MSTIIQNASIKRKITVAFAIICLAVVVLGGISFLKFRVLNGVVTEITENYLVSIGYLDKVRSNQLLYRLSFVKLLDSDLSKAESDALLRDLDGYKQRMDDSTAKYEPTVVTPQEKEIYAKYKERHDAFFAGLDAATKIFRQGKREEALAYYRKDIAGIGSAADELLSKDVDFNIAMGNEWSVKAQEEYRGGLIQVGVTVLAAMGFCLMLGTVLFRAISVPVVAMTGAMRRLAEGDKTIVIPAQDRGDEIGAMAHALEVFKENAIKSDRLAEEQAIRQAAEHRRGQAIESLTTGFDQAVTSVLNIVSGAATEMETTAEAMSANAGQTSRQSTIVAAASEEASTSVQAVASAAEQLASSIHEIGRQVENSSRVSQSASEEASQTNATVKGLAESSGKIGEVVKLISDIASQTNLLALNATIEAARAGEAGKGFAVVASEVKHLANQTAKATEEIGSQIGAVQSATRDAVAAIGGIVARIEEINEIAGAIAAAVEEQSAATAEIARNVQQAASGTQEVSANISGVTQAAGETGAAAGQVLSSAQSLAKEAVELREVVGKFLQGVRAA